MGDSMAKQNLTYVSVALGLTLTVMSFQNCAQRQFTEIPPEEKAAKLQGETVFGPNSAEIPGAGSVGSGVVPGSGTGNTGTNTGTGFGNNTMPGTSGGGTTGVSIITGTNPTGGTTGTSGTMGSANGYVDVKVLNLDAPSNPAQFSVKYVCSDQRTDKWGSVAASAALTVDVLAKEGNALVSKCSFSSADLRKTILEQKRIPTALVDQNCPALAKGSYVLNVRNSAMAEGSSIISSDYDKGYLKVANSNMKNAFVVTKGDVWSTSEPYIHLYTDRNPNKNSPDKKQDMVALNPAQCDSVASPLVIHMQAANARPEHLKFVSPAQGIDFDILGENSVNRAGQPSPHEKKRISWHRSQQYVYIVLPNASGKVEGINEMFGDNTKGPDGQFAANGYQALAKFDGMNETGTSRVGAADGYINSKDAIYKRLRIWRDENFDGISQADELYTLEKFGIKTIDLGYDPNYYEMDKWGNEVKYKSVVEGKDGKLYLMFDVWFRHYTL